MMTASDYTLQAPVPQAMSEFQQALGNIMGQIQDKKRMVAMAKAAYGQQGQPQGQDQLQPALGGGGVDPDTGDPSTSANALFGTPSGPTMPTGQPGSSGVLPPDPSQAWAAGTGAGSGPNTDGESPYALPAKKTSALRKALQLYNPDKEDQFDTMGKAELEGWIQGQQMKAANTMAGAKLQQMLKEGGYYDAHANYMNQRAAHEAQDDSESAAAGKAVNNYAAGQPITADDLQGYDVLGAMAPSSTKPTVAQLQAMQNTPQSRMLSAMATPGLGATGGPKMLDQLRRMGMIKDGAGAGTGQPFNWKSAAGNNYVGMDRTLMRDPAANEGSATPDVPGYQAVPDGRGGVQYLKTPTPQTPKVPTQFHATLDNISEQLANNQAVLDMSPQELKQTALGYQQTPENYLASAKRSLISNRLRARNTIDRYTTTGILTPDQRDQFYSEFGIANAAGPAGASRGGATNGVPMPSSKSQLKTGQVYATPRGAAKWDGSKFIAQ